MKKSQFLVFGVIGGRQLLMFNVSEESFRPTTVRQSISTFVPVHQQCLSSLCFLYYVCPSINIVLQKRDASCFERRLRIGIAKGIKGGTINILRIIGFSCITLIFK